MWAIVKIIFFISLCLFLLYRASVYFRAERFFAAIGALLGSMIFALAMYLDYTISDAAKKAASPGMADMTKAEPAEKKKIEKVAPDTEKETNSNEDDGEEAEVDFGEPTTPTEPTTDIEQ